MLRPVARDFADLARKLTEVADEHYEPHERGPLDALVADLRAGVESIEQKLEASPEDHKET
jgi:hypothetical protein